MKEQEACGPGPWFVLPSVFAIFAYAMVLAALLFGLPGCHSTAKEEQQVIVEGVSLVTGWEPDGPIRAAKKAEFLEDAKPYLPAPVPSPSPSPVPGGK